MDARRSFYLASRQDDFAESAADLSPIDCADIPYVMPANDNVRATFPLPKLDDLRRRKGAPDVLLEFDRAILHREANMLALGGMITAAGAVQWAAVGILFATY